jgi:hypothetical protein
MGSACRLFNTSFATALLTVVVCASEVQAQRIGTFLSYVPALWSRSFDESASRQRSLTSPRQDEAPYFKVIGIRFGNVLWVWSGPGTKYRRVGFLPYNARHIRNFGCYGPPRLEWCRISYRGRRAWARKAFLAPDVMRRI